MNLLHLLSADIYRDGGSYGARFSDSDNQTYTLWLQRSAMPDNAGLHHRSLFLYAGDTRPSDCKPIGIGTPEELSIVATIESILAADQRQGRDHTSHQDFERLRQMLSYIKVREPW
jgi:hypothetical protein